MASACGILRATESKSENACSAVEMVLPPGAFITMTPRLRGGLDIDIIDPDAGASDHAQNLFRL